jgi:hypothetical protein
MGTEQEENEQVSQAFCINNEDLCAITLIELKF